LAVPITGTSPSAQNLQLQIQRAMPGEQRLLLALKMSLFARELAKKRIRREYPEWSDTQVARELVRLTFPPGSGTSAVAMSVSEVFHRITSALGEAGISYTLAGSFASALLRRR
jgi:hypothetical protein